MIWLQIQAMPRKINHAEVTNTTPQTDCRLTEGSFGIVGFRSYVAPMSGGEG